MNEQNLFVFAGPDESGKSHLINKLRNDGLLPLKFRTISQIEPNGNLQGDYSDEIKRLQHDINLRESFVLQTVLSTDEELMFIYHAKAIGYCVNVTFVTSDYNTYRQRISNATGINLQKVSSHLYEESMCQMFDVMHISHYAAVYDNSGDKPILILKKDPYDHEYAYVYCGHDHNNAGEDYLNEFVVGKVERAYNKKIKNLPTSNGLFKSLKKACLRAANIAGAIAKQLGIAWLYNQVVKILPFLPL